MKKSGILKRDLKLLTNSIAIKSMKQKIAVAESIEKEKFIAEFEINGINIIDLLDKAIAQTKKAYEQMNQKEKEEFKKMHIQHLEFLEKEKEELSRIINSIL